MAAGDRDPLMLREPPGPGRASLPRAFLVIAPAMAAANVLNYAFNLVMSRLLGPAGYGALGALLAVVVVGAALGLLTLLVSPAIAAFLHLPSLGPCLWLAAALLPLPLLSAVQGMLQGREWFGVLAAVLLVAAAGRLAVGLGLVEGGLGVEGALAATAIGSAVAVLVAVPRLRAQGGWELRRGGWRWPGKGSPAAAVAGEVAAAAAGVLGLLLLANVDVLLARHFLPAEASGLYAAGAGLTKIAFWA